MKYSWYLGFGLAGIGMGIGMLVFALLSDKLLGDAGQNLERFSCRKQALLFAAVGCYSLLVIYGIKNATEVISYIKYVGLVVLGYYGYLIYTTQPKYRVNLYVLLALMFFYVVFYALEMQTGGLITVFASRNVNLVIGSYEIAAASIESINPLTVILSGLLISAILKDKSKDGYRGRLFAGLLCIPGAFAIFYLGTLFAENSIVPFVYLASGMVLMALGEIFIGPVIQAKTSSLSPKDKRGVMFGMVMFAASYANIVGNFAAHYMSVPVNNGIIDKAVSLAIYQAGFIAVIKFTGIAALLFLLISPFLCRAVEVTE